VWTELVRLIVGSVEDSCELGNEPSGDRFFLLFLLVYNLHHYKLLSKGVVSG
jgi:hypothetical protein